MKVDDKKMQNKERKEGKVEGGRKEEGRGGRKDEHEVMIDAISSD